MEDNEQSKQTNQRPNDRFSRLMGEKREYTMEDNEQSKQTNQRSNDRFSRLMFGPFPPQQSTNPSQNRETAPQQGLDFIQLMQDIDTLVSSFDKLKPLMKKFTSFVDLLKK
jgi:hypothetical protein